MQICDKIVLPKFNIDRFICFKIDHYYEMNKKLTLHYSRSGINLFKSIEMHVAYILNSTHFRQKTRVGKEDFYYGKLGTDSTYVLENISEGFGLRPDRLIRPYSQFFRRTYITPDEKHERYYRVLTSTLSEIDLSGQLSV